MIVCIPDLLDAGELARIREGVASLEFIDGKATAGFRAKRVKNNLQLPSSDQAGELGELVRGALGKNPQFARAAVARTIRQPLISRYHPGMEYGLHVDDALMGTKTKVRSDLSVTVFLSDPVDYDGGELVIHTPYGNQEVKLPAGSAVIYPSGTLHKVAPVTRGERLAAVTWVQSFVRDPALREILHDLDLIRRRLDKASPQWPETDLAYKTYANLLRLWSEL